MDHDTIVKTVNSIFVERFELDESELTPDKRIIEDLQLDSLDLVDMIVGLQQKFGIMLRDKPEVRAVRTLGDVYILFEKLAKEHPEIEEKFR